MIFFDFSLDSHILVFPSGLQNFRRVFVDSDYASKNAIRGHLLDLGNLIITMQKGVYICIYIYDG